MAWLLFVSAIIFSFARFSLGESLIVDDSPVSAAQDLAHKAAKAIDGGKYDEAIGYADKALEINPDYAGAYNLRGLALYYKDEPDLSKKAIADFDKAISLKPDVSAYYANRGNAKRDIGLYDSDIEDQNIALKLSPHDATAYTNRAGAYHKKKQYDLAIADFSRALEIDPNNFTAHRDRANAYYRKDEYDLAIKDYTLALKLRPKDSEVYWQRGRAYLDKGELGLAIADCSRSLEINPKQPAAYFIRGNAYRAKGEFDPAINDYSRYIELKPDQKGFDGYYGRAMAYKAKGEVNEALSDLKKAVAFNPEKKKFKDELKILEETFGIASVAPLPRNGRTTTAAPAASAPAPAASSEGARVLAPFKGYTELESCKQSGIIIPGVPWQPEGPKDDAAVMSSELGQYEALLRHTMQGLRLFYGSMTEEEDKSFNAFWAPFFDHPTKAALEYFREITPLLDEMAVTLNDLDGSISNLGVGLQEFLLDAGDPTSITGGIASAAYQSVLGQRAKLNDLLKKIQELGNPPNPLAAKCRARKRHRQAISTPAPKAGEHDILELAKKAEHLGMVIHTHYFATNADLYNVLQKIF